MYDARLVEIIPLDNGIEDSGEEYLLKITKTYYKDDGNQEPTVAIVDHEETCYKLYLKESTVRKIFELTN